MRRFLITLSSALANVPACVLPRQKGPTFKKNSAYLSLFTLPFIVIDRVGIPLSDLLALPPFGHIFCLCRVHFWLYIFLRSASVGNM